MMSRTGKVKMEVRIAEGLKKVKRAMSPNKDGL
jgi:hypothetical protein